MITWFSRLSKDKLSPIDFSSLVVDMHSHLIPSIDDGSKDIDDSITMISGLKDLGFSKIITTPHIMSDYYRNDPKIINQGLKDVKEGLHRLDVSMTLEAAAEYYIDFEFQRMIRNNDLLVFGDKYLLVELPFMQELSKLDEIIFDLQLHGYNVVLAHPERYLYYNLEDYKRLVSKGIFLQVNLLSLVGYYSSQVKKQSKILIDNNLVSFLGTDCHNIHQLSVLEECFVSPIWHQVLDSGKLLNHTLV